MRHSRKNHDRLIKGAALIPALLAIAACTPENIALMVGTSAVSMIETDKTVPDHIMSQVMNKDCAASRLIKDGKMCLDDDGTTTVAESAPTYCYHTLGEITCYATPNPYDPHTNEVAWPRGEEPAPMPSVALRDGENKGH